jgi:hypothetical protein
VISVSVFVVAAVSSVIIAIALTAIAYLGVRLARTTTVRRVARTTRRHLEEVPMASRWVTWLGIVIALAGVVIGIWLLVLEGGTYPFGSTIGAKVTTEARLQDVSLGLTMIGAGALLAVGAQIMGMMQAAAQRQASN